MRALRRLVGNARHEDEGSILMAMLGMLSLTAIMLVLLASILAGVNVSRHDAAFEQSLHGAEEGMDLVVAQIRQAPLATSFATLTDTDPASGAHYTTTTTGGSGHWVVTSVGTATNGGRTVTRRITQHVDTANLLAVPLVGKDELTLGGASGASGVENYDSSVSSAVCDSGGLPLGLNTLVSLPATGTTTATMCTKASPALGGALTEGPLTMSGSDVNDVSQVDVYGAAPSGFTDPGATGRCVGDVTTCSASNVLLHPGQVPYPVSDLCAKGIGGGVASFDGSSALAANSVYSFTDVTLNAAAIANLANPGATQLVICFSGTLTLPPAVALNTTVGNAVPLRLDPRPPASLLLISTTPTCSTPGCTPAAPVVDFGLDSATKALSALPSSVSAVVYAPNATCKAGGHVDVFGAVVCGTVDASAGMEVHYDKQLALAPFDSTVQVSKWHEVTGGS